MQTWIDTLRARSDAASEPQPLPEAPEATVPVSQIEALVNQRAEQLMADMAARFDAQAHGGTASAGTPGTLTAAESPSAPPEGTTASGGAWTAPGGSQA